MPIITSIKQQKNKNRVNIYLDDKFGFGIDLDNFVILGLKVNQELNENEVEDIIKKAEYQKIFDKLLKFAMIRPRSYREIRDYFRRKEVPDLIQKDLFLQLKHFELIDDEKFAKWWLEMNSYRSRSLRVLKLELMKKGISKNIIDDVLSETKIDEDKLSKVLLLKRENHWKNVEKAKRENKMLEYLVRKGFGFEVARRAVKEYNIGHG